MEWTTERLRITSEPGPTLRTVFRIEPSGGFPDALLSSEALFELARWITEHRCELEAIQATGHAYVGPRSERPDAQRS